MILFRWLYRDGFLPEGTRFIGYARSQITIDKIFENAIKYMKVNFMTMFVKFTYKYLQIR